MKPNRVSLFAALVTAVLAFPAATSLPVPAPPGRTQRVASPEAVPEGLSSLDWPSIRQQYDQHRHRAVAVEGGHQARNPAQQWLTRFDGRGFLTQPDAGGWQWGLDWVLYSKARCAMCASA
jgi:hypothetical protein